MMRKFLRRDPVKYPFCLVDVSDPKNPRRWVDAETQEKAEKWRANWKHLHGFTVMSRVTFEEQKASVTPVEMWECQICGRIDLQSPHGKISHHGYERPGDGWQTESCRGARRLPYQVSNDAIPEEIKRVRNFIERETGLLAVIERGEVAVRNPRYNPMGPLHMVRAGVPPLIEPGDTKFADAVAWNVKATKRRIEGAQREEVRLQGRFDNWKPKP